MDITELKRADVALRSAQLELAHLTRVVTLGELAASIAHEVNQPLAAIVSNGEAGLRWLRRSRPELDEARASLEAMIRDGIRAGEVVHRIRGLAKKADASKQRAKLYYSKRSSPPSPVAWGWGYRSAVRSSKHI